MAQGGSALHALESLVVEDGGAVLLPESLKPTHLLFSSLGGCAGNLSDGRHRRGGGGDGFSPGRLESVQHRPGRPGRPDLEAAGHSAVRGGSWSSRGHNYYVFFIGFWKKVVLSHCF